MNDEACTAAHACVPLDGPELTLEELSRRLAVGRGRERSIGSVALPSPGKAAAADLELQSASALSRPLNAGRLMGA